MKKKKSKKVTNKKKRKHTLDPILEKRIDLKVERKKNQKKLRSRQPTSNQTLFLAFPFIEVLLLFP